MKKNILVLDEEHKNLLKLDKVNLQAMTPMDYILNGDLKGNRADVYNFSGHLNYQDSGYYVSLLAQARGDKVYPSAITIQELKDRYMQKLYSIEIFEKIQSKLKKISSDKFELSVFFGKNLTESYNSLAWEFFKIFKAPLFRLYFEKYEKWHLKKVKLLCLEDLTPTQLEFLQHRMEDYFRLEKRPRERKNPFIYDLAILVNHEEKSPPSNQKALKKFVEAAKTVGIKAELVEYVNRPNIFEYDALFIRETTNVNHHTYRMANRAQKEGLVVIDDPDSIVRCTNKVYLEQLADKLNIKRPKSLVISRSNIEKKLPLVTYPCVVKKPDSAFSQGVYKANNEEELIAMSENLFKKSQLLLLQEYLPTDYDWRIGVLGGNVLYVCKYFMAKGHWQIYNNSTSGDDNTGDFECIPPEQAPPNVLKAALKITKNIGNGLYGVDLKQKGNDIYLIEVNDNPSIDSGVEDSVMGDALYEKIMEHFLEQCNKKRRINGTV